VTWHASKDADGTSHFQPLVDNETVDLKEPKEFRLAIPLKADNVFMPEFGKIGKSTAVMRYLSVRGHLTPTLGVMFAKKEGTILIEKVKPKGLGDYVGLKASDVLESVNGNSPKSVQEATTLLSKLPFGEESEITVKRGGKTITIGFTAE